MKVRPVAMVAALVGSLVVVGFSSMTPAHAGVAPTECIVPQVPAKPIIAAADLPNCVDIEGLCIDYIYLEGPGRAVHAARSGRAVPAGGAVISPRDDCASFGACGMRVQEQLAPPPGPARPAHAASRVPSGGVAIYNPGDIFPIPSSCFDLPETGIDLAPVLFAGIVALAAGLAITGLRRRTA